MSWTQAPANIGTSGNSFLNGGLPEVEPKWNISDQSKMVNYMTKVVAEDDYVFFNEGGNITCRDLSSGQVLWQHHNNDVYDHLLQFALVGGYLYSQGALFECNSGKKIHDFFENISPRPKFDLGAQIFERKIYLEERGESGRHFIFDTEQFTTALVHSELRLIRFDCHNNQKYGWQDNYLFVCMDQDSNKAIWEVSLDYVFENNYSGATKGNLPQIFQANHLLIIMSSSYSAICCIDSRSGDIIWEHSIVEHHEHLQGPIFRPAISEKFICFAYLNKNSGAYNYICLDINTGAIIWKRFHGQIGYIRCNPVISGDLIFHGIDIKSHSYTQLVAFDIYTGDLVWKAKDILVSAYHLIAHKNAVIYTSTMGEISCFEWEKEYISPCREMTVNELINKNATLEISKPDKIIKKKSWFKKIFD